MQSLLEHWQAEPSVSSSVRMLLGAFTDWKPGRSSHGHSDPETVSTVVENWGGKTLPVSALPEWMQANLAALKSASEQVM